MIILPNGNPLTDGSTVMAQAVYIAGRAPEGGLSLLQKYSNDRAFSPAVLQKMSSSPGLLNG
ncbi:MAG: hypothetical protein AB1416_11335 [Actinomycetota bacterium]